MILLLKGRHKLNRFTSNNSRLEEIRVSRECCSEYDRRFKFYLHGAVVVEFHPYLRADHKFVTVSDFEEGVFITT
jgi:hypothetical protein